MSSDGHPSDYAEVMGAHPNAICTRVLDEESARREHVVVSLSGAICLWLASKITNPNLIFAGQVLHVPQ